MSDLLSYSDETGSHTGGRYFIVAGIALDGYHNQVRIGLRQAENSSGKEKADWHGSAPDVRVDYLEECLNISHLKGRIFFHIWKNIVKTRMLLHTADTLAAAAQYFGIDNRSVRAHHEGFTVGSRKRLEGLLRSAGDFEVRSGWFNQRPEIRPE